jgi:hypothetical protein
MEESFAKAAARIEEHYGFELPLSAVGKATRKHADGIARLQDGRKGSHQLPYRGKDMIIAEADGSFLRIVSTQANKTDRRKTRKVDYKEARLCAARACGSDKIRYDATFADVRHIAELWSFTAKDAGMGLNSKVHIVADGAPWIYSEAQRAFGKQGSFLIDLYHVLEYLHQAAPSCSENPQRWLNTQKKRLNNGHWPKVIRELEQNLEAESMAEEQAPVRCAWRYLNNRRDCLAYDLAREQGLPAGSGMIESGNKHVLQARLKIPGASWTQKTAENFARARAFRANGQWNQYWKPFNQAAA